MSKDHKPSDFGRPSGYKSDLEVGETGPNVKSINTSFGSKNHNVYVMRSDHTHEHFFYDPVTQRQGWHGNNYHTKNNHPHVKGGKKMSGEKNEFLERIRVDKETQARLNEVAKNQNHVHNRSNKGTDDGGRERGDEGPGTLGREAGNKGANATSGHSTQGSEGHNDSGGHGGNAGDGGGGHTGNSGGHGAGCTGGCGHGGK